MKIKVTNCNNIEYGELVIEEGKLNIKYGINGTGKSTFAKALKLKDNSEQLKSLKTYGKEATPTIELVDTTISDVLTYDSQYINSFLFKENNIYTNSYDVFIKPDLYDEKIDLINNVLHEINVLLQSDELFLLLKNMNETLSDVIKVNAGGDKITKASKINTLVKSHIIGIMDPLVSEFELYFNSDNAISWADWHVKGQGLLMEPNCPFCGKVLEENYSEINEVIKEKFSKKTIETYNIINTSINNCLDIFSSETIDNVKRIISPAEVGDEGCAYLINLKNEINKIVNILNNINAITFSDLKNQNIVNFLDSKKIDCTTLNFLTNEVFISKINEYNIKIDEIITNVTFLVREVNILNTNIRNTASENITKINNFLASAGIDYEIVTSDDYNTLLLKPILEGVEMYVDASKHLSYGEKNALALALFSFEAKRSNNKLIILDDPISSYDETKKYSIMHFLFSGEKVLQNKTVIMFTHDIEPIINLYKINRSIPSYVNSFYIKNTEGVISEEIINTSDIINISTGYKKGYEDNNKNIVSRLINLRKYIEIMCQSNNEYSMLSSLFKLRMEPTHDIDGQDKFSQIEIVNTQNSIASKVEGFNYDVVRVMMENLSEIVRLYQTSNSNYEKLELFRIITVSYDMEAAKIIMKFVKEAYHIENAYLFQLDPTRFNTIPNYVISACDSFVESIDLENN